ncbi:uncharacterized protein LOC128887790 [Hylaeus anthracinus]|uniref:uncharacterized protein LOC128875556 n=1 Tax=Hylaeus volcanicus TaxID=313075 RepID=UPI0023B7883E|nr:uncharacterized protein LOC128875556 [Hylaeus volcanicus]XP_053977198.1 uncharacterized protein LOC128875556 [Hylaeus volcanicus]XP_054000104.1 uncharacterized protein LOC128887790 [Hylaeus anthracinus]XP_054000113.1 uncharacterized protein LOC128887790 [Hylaeus anthracinus]
MLTVMCPNCRHRFPAPGCCEPQRMEKDLIHPATCYYGGLLVPKGYTSGGDCFINAPTIIHSQPIINSFNYPSMALDLEKTRIDKQKDSILQRSEKNPRIFGFPLVNEEIEKNQNSGCQITTSSELTGGSLTITTPSIQSGGCLIQSTDSGILMQTPHVEIRPKLSGGGCFVQKTSTENQEALITLSESKDHQQNMNCGGRMVLLPPSGCQELPGTRRNILPQKIEERTSAGNFTGGNNEKPVLSSFQVTSTPILQFQESKNSEKSEQELEQGRNLNCCCSHVQNLYHNKPNSPRVSENRNSVLLDSNSGVQIQVNATVQIPASLGQCTVNITASTTNPPNSLSSIASRTRNNFNGGGLVQENEVQNNEENFEERRDRTPTTPVSWLMPCPWSFDSYMIDKDAARLCEVKRLLQTCGWYHEGLSWQQSENLLKNAAVGRWLMRDSSDIRYTFAVSVQTARGPTSVRVHYFVGQFRLDAEPRLAFAIPLFDCPIKMLEYYVEYSKTVDEHRKEVWVDYSGQLYSEIYLTKPLVKEVRSLSHLARLVVNRCKLSTEHLPPLIKNYLAEYPYTL